MKQRTGQCLCGQITYTVVGEPKIVAQCHCEECRRQSGTGHSIGAMFKAEAVQISGEPSEYVYASSMGSEVRRGFCASCGSSLYGRNSRMPDHMTLTLGTMNEAEGLSVQVVVFAGRKPHWDDLPETAMIFEEQPGWTPESEGAD